MDVALARTPETADPGRDPERIPEGVEAPLLQDGFEVVEGPGPVENPEASVHTKRKNTREQILDSKKRILDRYSSGLASGDSNGIAGNASSEQSEKLREIGRTALEAKLDTIIGDPKKNARTILKELHAMERNAKPVSAPDKEKKKNVSTEAFSTEGAKISFEDAKGYLSELVLEHYLPGLEKGKFSDGVPLMSLNTLIWRDGRRLRDVLSKKDSDRFHELIRTVEDDLRDIHETERGVRGKNEAEKKERQKKILADIQTLFISADEAIARLKSAKDLGELESVEFPDISMRALKQMGLKSLPKNLTGTVSAAQKESISRWKETKAAEGERIRNDAKSAKAKKQKPPKNDKPEKSKLFGGRTHVKVGEKPETVDQDVPAQESESVVPEKELVNKEDALSEKPDKKEAPIDEGSLEKAVASAFVLGKLYETVEGYEGSLHEDGRPENAWNDSRREDLVRSMRQLEADALVAAPDEYAFMKKSGSFNLIPSQGGIREKFVELIEKARTNNALLGNSGAKEEAKEEAGKPAPESERKGESPSKSEETSAETDAREKTETAERARLVEERRSEVERLKSEAKEQGDKVAKIEEQRLMLKKDLARLQEEERESKKFLASVLSVFHTEDRMMNISGDVAKVAEEVEKLKEDFKTESLKRDELRATLLDAEKDLAALLMDEMTDADSPKEEAQASARSAEKTKGKEFEGGKEKRGNSPIPEYVYEKFEELGITLGDLKEIRDEEGSELFSRLSEGQQLLVFENLKQVTLGRIREEADNRVGEEAGESGWAGRLWKAISKKHQIAKAERSAASDIVNGGMHVHGEMLKQLVSGMYEQGPEVRVANDGSLEIRFVSGIEDFPEKDRYTVDAFNDAANAFAKIPYEWSLDTASEEEQERYQMAKERYEEVLGKAKGVIEGHAGSVPEAYLTMNDIEGKVEMMRFLQTHPEVEKQLDNLKDQGAWTYLLKNVVTERGAYFALGYTGRTLLAGALGWAAAPVVAAGMGGFIARKRTKESLRTHDVEARRGKKDRSGEAKNVIGSETIRMKLSDLMRKVSEENGEKGQARTALRLKARIEYIRRKIEDGAVDFGGVNDRMRNQFDIIKTLSEAEAVAGIYSGENEELTDRLHHFLDIREERIGKRRERHIRNQVLKGAALSAGFALVGAAIREAQEHGWFSGLWHGSGGETPPSEAPGEPSAFLKATGETGGATGNPSGDLDPESWGKPSSSAETMTSPAEPSPYLKATAEVPGSATGVPNGGEPLIGETPPVPAGASSAAAEATVKTVTETVPEAANAELVVEPGSGRSIEGTIKELLRTTDPDSSTIDRDAHEMVRSYAEAHDIPLGNLDRIASAKIDLVRNAGGDFSIKNLEFQSAGSGATAQAVAEQAAPETVAPVSAVDAGTPREIASTATQMAQEATAASQEVAFHQAEAVSQGAPTVGEEAVSTRIQKAWEENVRDAKLNPQDPRYKLGTIPRDDVPIPAEQAGVSPEVSAVREFLRTNPMDSKEAMNYLVGHPDMLEPYRAAFSRAEAFILGSGEKGVRHLSELPENLSVKQVVEENFRVLSGDPPSSKFPLELDQMKQAGEFIANAARKFWENGQSKPLPGESFGAYIERMEMLSLSKDGKPIPLEGGVLEKLYQNAKK